MLEIFINLHSNITYMEDTLLSQRKYFNERLEKTSKIKNLKIRYQTKLDLLPKIMVN